LEYDIGDLLNKELLNKQTIVVNNSLKDTQMKNHGNSLRIWILSIITIVVIHGCAGPKFMSDSSGTVSASENIPVGERISIIWTQSWRDSKTTDGKTRNQFIAEVLAKELRLYHLFEVQDVVPDTVEPESPLQFKVWLEGSTESGWCARSFSPGTSNSVTVGGTLVDQSRNVSLISFSKSRKAQGGVCGIGGYLSPDDVAMNKTLIEWVIEDVVKDIKKTAGQ
jgi:hypothetical protein